MNIIINKLTKKVINNMGTNSMFPAGFDIEVGDNEELIKVNDNSQLAKDIMELSDYDLVFENGSVVGVSAIKTLEESNQEYLNSNAFKKVDAKNKIIMLDKDLNRGTEDLIDLLLSKQILTEQELPSALKSKRQQKSALRQQIQGLE